MSDLFHKGGWDEIVEAAIYASLTDKRQEKDRKNQQSNEEQVRTDDKLQEHLDEVPLIVDQEPQPKLAATETAELKITALEPPASYPLGVTAVKKNIAC